MKQPSFLNLFHFLLLLAQKLLQLFEVVHEDPPPLQRPLLHHDLRLREQFEQIFKDVLRRTQERGPILFGCLFQVVLFSADFDNKRRPQVKHELVLAEE